jgi:hypothetical protein
VFDAELISLDVDDQAEHLIDGDGWPVTLQPV